MSELAIRVDGLETRFGSNVIHENLNLEVYRGEVMGIVGGSGTGKSVLLNTIVGLRQPNAGRIEVLGQGTAHADAKSRAALRRRWGVLFQDGALFSSLTVLQNIEVPLRFHTRISAALRRELAAVKLSLAGLSPDAGPKYPGELSGGMRKRAGLARALALDPDILFLDEPTAGLDPIGAAGFDELIKDLRASLGLTVVMVTHDLDSLYAVCDRVAVLVDRRVKVGTISELVNEPDPWIHEYFDGPRGRQAGQAHGAA
ncbi:ABC transporter ATP-binding protein [Fodinicurvata halophila]|uniref:ABC transporter ATP-binding protein n=1 Tax=Fodinicurvata halophila TaxID=1419723 RepID=A0ABV8UHW3_9PROT